MQKDLNHIIEFANNSTYLDKRSIIHIGIDKIINRFK